jgi:general secretion pathway protein C
MGVRDNAGMLRTPSWLHRFKTSPIKGLGLSRAASPSLKPSTHLHAASRASWGVKGSTFLIWALVASSAVFWGLKWSKPPAAPTQVSTPLSSTTHSPALPQLLSLFNSISITSSAEPELAPQNTSDGLQLLGVVTGQYAAFGGSDKSSHAVALIAFNGEAAKPYALGQSVAEQWRVISIERQRVLLQALKPGQPRIALEVPRPDAAGR